MKNAFYMTIEAFFILKIFKVFLPFLVMQKNGLIRKIMLFQNFWCDNLGNKVLKYTYWQSDHAI